MCRQCPLRLMALYVAVVSVTQTVDGAVPEMHTYYECQRKVRNVALTANTSD